MAEATQGFSAIDSERRKVMPAEIIRKETIFGNIRIRCPVDGTEWEVSKNLKSYVCPVGGERLLITL